MAVDWLGFAYAAAIALGGFMGYKRKGIHIVINLYALLELMFTMVPQSTININAPSYSFPSTLNMIILKVYSWKMQKLALFS